MPIGTPFRGLAFFVSAFPRIKGVATMKTTLLAASVASILSAGSAFAGACTGEIDQLTKTMATKDAGSGPTAGGSASTSSEAPRQAQHPPGAIMTQQTESKATSPEDVRRQTEGRPTTSQQTSVSGIQRDHAAASASLAKAKEHDAAGRESECMEAVKNAKS